MITKTALLALTCLAASPAWAVNKCSIDGKTVFQDAACPGKGEVIRVRPASGTAPATTAEASTSPGAPAKKPLTEAQRIEGRVKESQNARRKRALEELLVPGTQQEIWAHRKGCDSEFDALRDKKRYAKNNLAGATWENSISSEMAAVATRCDSKAREMQAQLESMTKECAALGGCQR